LEGHANPVKCLSFSKDNKFLASGSRDPNIIIWKIEDFKFQEYKKIDLDYEVLSIVFPEVRNTILVGMKSRLINYNFEEGKKISEFDT
jgi:WD40 repeat protein